MEKKRLGQHFLTDIRVLDTILESARLTFEETVLEVGPGEGVLTERLLKVAGKVLAVEKDRELVLKLKKRFVQEIEAGTLILIEGDIRDVLEANSLQLKASNYAVVANIPYYLTGILIRQLLSGKTLPNRMVLLIQKEVAERIAREKKESLLSLSVKVYGSPRFIASVPKNAFKPQPSVESAVLSIEKISRDFLDTIDESAFFKTVRAGFGKKRKLLMSNLVGIYPKERVVYAFEALGYSKNARAEDLSLTMWEKLVQKLTSDQ
jgi:16S rRNA (adenine1518-N6/adenine1519-N6)-dimethyltransferase